MFQEFLTECSRMKYVSLFVVVKIRVKIVYRLHVLLILVLKIQWSLLNNNTKHSTWEKVSLKNYCLKTCSV